MGVRRRRGEPSGWPPCSLTREGVREKGRREGAKREGRRGNECGREGGKRRREGEKET